MGYPIANDPLYSHEKVWGKDVGRGGVALVPQNGESSRAAALAMRTGDHPDEEYLADRELANIDVTSPIRLSTQAKEIIGKLRRMKDEQEDWIKWAGFFNMMCIRLISKLGGTKSSSQPNKPKMRSGHLLQPP